MKYMLLLYAAPQDRPAPGSPEMDAEFESWMSYTREIAASGSLIAGDALHPVQTATTVRVRDGRGTTTDGPFAETKETLGGYYLLDVDAG